MASRLAGYVAIQGCAAQRVNVMRAFKLAAQNRKVIYNQILEKNKRHILRHAGSLLAKQLFHTRLASIPGSYESFWKELDGMKGLKKGRKRLRT